MLKDIKFYVVNLKESEDRRIGMRHRFGLQGFADQIVFVEAINVNSPLIDFYDAGKFNHCRRITSALISHIKAIRLFLETNEEYCFVCEDDAILANNFAHKFYKLMENVPKDCPLVQLSILPAPSWSTYTWGGIDPSKKNLLNETQDSYSACVYLISKKYALDVIRINDNPFFGLKKENGLGHNTEFTPEIIPRHSGGLIAIPPLALEECAGSTVGHSSNYAASIHAPWIYTRYSKGLDMRHTCFTNYGLQHLWRNILSRSQILNLNKWAVKHLKPLYENLNILDSHNKQQFLSLYYVSAFYHDKNFAREVANKYIECLFQDPNFRQSYLNQKPLVDSNFAHLDITIQLS